MWEPSSPANIREIPRRGFAEENFALSLSHLETLDFSTYSARSPSSMSMNLFSKAPLKGMRAAPGSFLSTHSLILINLEVYFSISRRNVELLILVILATNDSYEFVKGTC